MLDCNMYDTLSEGKARILYEVPGIYYGYIYQNNY